MFIPLSLCQTSDCGLRCLVFFLLQLILGAFFQNSDVLIVLLLSFSVNWALSNHFFNFRFYVYGYCFLIVAYSRFPTLSRWTMWITRNQPSRLFRINAVHQRSVWTICSTSLFSKYTMKSLYFPSCKWPVFFSYKYSRHIRWGSNSAYLRNWMETERLVWCSLHILLGCYSLNYWLLLNGWNRRRSSSRVRSVILFLILFFIFF